MSKVSKAELVDRIASKTGASRSTVYAIVHRLLDEMTKDLCQGNDVCLKGFGRFRCVVHSAGKARNPRTGESIDFPARRHIKFKAGVFIQGNSVVSTLSH